MRTRKRTVQVLGMLSMMLWISACEDLVIPNENEPDRARSLSKPTDIESLVGSTFLLWWQVNHGLGTAAETRPSAAVGALAAYGNEVTSSSAHYGIQDIGRRPIAPEINDPGSSWHPYVEGTWQELYKVLSGSREALLALNDPAFKLGANGVDNARLKTFAKFMQGMALSSLGYIYKEAYVLDETVTEDQLPTLKLKPYGEVMAAGLKSLDEAAKLAAANSFTIPVTWMTVAWTNQDLVRIAHSYRARFMAGVGRTPAERAAVNWANVLAEANAGITKDFGVNADGPGGRWKSEIISAHGATYTSGGGRKMHNDIVGPADQTGAWQTWKAADYTKRREITIETDDRRIHGAGGPKTIGTEVQWWATSGMAESRGLYYFSLYADIKWRDYRRDLTGYLMDMPLMEMDFLKAEANLRLGNAQAAADLINKTRVGKGQLPPITPAGASGARCVPRTVSGACGTLLDALKYEKGLELWLQGMGVRFSDMRGWGLLEQGSILHLPVPKNELTLAGREFYTTGGIGGIDAAPAPSDHAK
jgi:starch-binding outer membrane protein, SusD/RagB family